MKRIFDLTLAAALLAICSLPMLCIALLIKVSSRGPVLHRSTRVGKDNVLFRMPKFRTMYIETPQLATHLLTDPQRWITPIGALLRKTSLDELPQLWSIIAGDMSFVGPRPALFNQHDLVQLRSSRGIDALLPGLTGWAQINGRDNLSIPDKVALDESYLQHRSLSLDVWIIARTLIQAALGVDVANTDPSTVTDSKRRAA
jgi:O-antigen biosynthesis protein WbqP